MGITHVIHTTLQADTHHTRALTHRLQRRSQLNLRDMITLNLLLHDILMQLRKDLRCQDILSEHTVKFFHTLLVPHTQELLGITGLGFLLHHSHIENGMILVLPDTRENAIMTHLSQRNGMNRHHQRVVTLVLLHHLQSTGLVAVTAIERITQEQQYRFVTRKLRRLIHRMTKTALLTLVDIMQVLANIQNARLQLLRLSIELAQMLIRQGPLEIIRIQLALLLRTQHQTDLLDTTLNQLLEQDQNHRTYHAIRTGNGEEVLLQSPCSRIESRAKASHGNDRLADRMHRLQRQ